jgi:hypothetical protein
MCTFCMFESTEHFAITSSNLSLNGLVVGTGNRVGDGLHTVELPAGGSQSYASCHVPASSISG